MQIFKWIFCLTWRELGVELVLLLVKRRLLGGTGISLGCILDLLPSEVFRARPNGRRPWGRPNTHWRDCLSHLIWDRPGIPRRSWEALMKTFGTPCLACCYWGPALGEWMDGVYLTNHAHWTHQMMQSTKKNPFYFMWTSSLNISRHHWLLMLTQLLALMHYFALVQQVSGHDYDMK